MLLIPIINIALFMYIDILSTIYTPSVQQKKSWNGYNI